ncbi:MAG: ArnT family glycosyltransferase [Acidiferrobacterales bacterium]
MIGTDQSHPGISFPRSGTDILLSDPDGIFDSSYSNAGRSNDILLTVLVSLSTVTTFLSLFVLRSLDDNRLTSWQWTVAGADTLTILFVLVLGIFLAYLLSNISLPVRKPAIWLFIGSFSISAIFWGEPEMIVDTSRYFVQAKYLELFGVGYFFKEWGNNISAWTDLPLVPLLYGLVFKFFGEYRAGIQILNSLLFSGTVVLTYLVGKELWDKRIGLYGGLLLLGIPYLFTQVPLMLVDVPSMFFFTLALYMTIKAVKQGGAVLLLSASATIVLAMLSKYSVWLLLSVIPVIFLSHIEYGRKVILQRAAIIALAAVPLIGLVLLWKYNVIVDQLRLLQSYQIPGLKRWGESFTSTFLFQIHPYITLAALFSIFAAIKKKDVKYAIIGWLLFLVLVLEIKRARYLIIIFPMLALMAAYGIEKIRNRKIGRFIVSSAVVSALVIAIFGYLPFFKNTSAVNLDQAGKYLDSMDAETIEVVTLPQTRSIVNPAVSVPILDLYTKKTLVYRYDKKLVPRPESVEKSSLRFTWEYRNPEYFFPDTGIQENSIPVAIIFSGRNQTIPARVAKRIAGHRLAKELVIMDRVFRYQTIIRVYQPV